MNRFTRIRYLQETGSTNDDMAAMLGEERSRGLTLVADYQRSGLGRKGRSWIARPGTALLCTIALPEAIAANDLWIVPFWTALAVRRAIARFGVQSTLQWPNDVLIHGHKVAGILCISRVTGERAWAACGVGINVKRPQDEAAVAEITPAPAFLGDSANVERNALLQALLEEADASYGDLGAPSKIVSDWNAAADLPGARYRIALDGDTRSFEATALGLAAGGSLLVNHDGNEREITMADARVLRQ